MPMRTRERYVPSVAAALAAISIDAGVGVTIHPRSFHVQRSLDARLTPENADAAIDETIAWFKSRGADRFGVDACQHDADDIGPR